MQRTFPKIAAVLSLALFIATAGLWLRSYWRADAFDVRVTLDRQADGTILWRHFKLWSSRGGLIARWERHWYTAALPKRKAFDWITAKPGTYYDHRDRWEGLYLFRADFGARGRGRVDVNGDEPAESGAPPVGSELYLGDWFYFPHWALMLALSIPWLTMMFRARRRRRRADRGLCPACGYDLRASPDCCPECGTAAPLPGQSGRS